jgi:hypothetical protein
MALTPEEKRRELRLRRKAQRQDLELRRNKTRDPDAPGFGLWQLWKVSRRGLSRPVTRGWLSLDGIEKELTK